MARRNYFPHRTLWDDGGVGEAKAEDWKTERGEEWKNIVLSLWRCAVGGADIAL